MNQDFSELVQYLDEKFSNIDGKFSNIDKMFFNANQKLDDLQKNKADKTDVSELMTSIDAYAKKADAYFQEMVMLSHQVNRHEKWLHQIAEKLSIKLKY